MFTNIVVPLDGTAQSNAALPLARTVARATGGTISLVRVVTPSEHATAAHVLDDLQRVAKELSDGDASVKCAVRSGEEVAREILEEIREQSIDLVIMCTRGRAGLERAVLGSVTQEVLAESVVPIMLLRPGGRRITQIRRLLVPVDGSPGGTLALGTAVQLAKVTGASMQLLQVVVPLSMSLYTGDAFGRVSYYDPAWDEEALAGARTYVDNLASRLRAADVAAEGEARQQPVVAEAIVNAADAANTDVIVMSTRALTGPARALLGSTADAVVRTSHCPVLLLHRTRVPAI